MRSIAFFATPDWNARISPSFSGWNPLIQLNQPPPPVLAIRSPTPSTSPHLSESPAACPDSVLPGSLKSQRLAQFAYRPWLRGTRFSTLQKGCNFLARQNTCDGELQMLQRCKKERCLFELFWITFCSRATSNVLVTGVGAQYRLQHMLRMVALLWNTKIIQYHLRTRCSAHMEWSTAHIFKYHKGNKICTRMLYATIEWQMCNFFSFDWNVFKSDFTVAGLKCVCVCHLLTPPLALH